MIIITKLLFKYIVDKMKNQTLYDIKKIIDLLGRVTPDTLNITDCIISRNHEISIPELPVLREAVNRSLAEKTNREFSQSVKKIKSEIIASLSQQLQS
jgi:hypothetical protein